MKGLVFKEEWEDEVLLIDEKTNEVYTLKRENFNGQNILVIECQNSELFTNVY